MEGVSELLPGAEARIASRQQSFLLSRDFMECYNTGFELGFKNLILEKMLWKVY
jgi:hypothetical protein